VLAIMKEREPRYQVMRQRLAARGERAGVLTPATAALGTQGGTARVPATRSPGARPSTKGATPSPPGALRPGVARSRAAGAPTGDRNAEAPGDRNAGAPGDTRAGATDGPARPTASNGQKAAGATNGAGPRGRRPPPRSRRGPKPKKRR